MTTLDIKDAEASYSDAVRRNRIGPSCPWSSRSERSWGFISLHSVRYPHSHDKKIQPGGAASLLSDDEKTVPKIDPDKKMDAIPIDPLTAGVVVIGTLSVIAALYFGKEVILPIALAIVLKLLLQPIVDGLCSILRIPTVVGALILISCLCAGLGAVGFIVSGPASRVDSESSRGAARVEREARPAARTH